MAMCEVIGYLMLSNYCELFVVTLTLLHRFVLSFEILLLVRTISV